MPNKYLLLIPAISVFFPVICSGACDTSISGSDTIVTCSYYDLDSNIIKQDKYSNGLKHGEQKTWYSDGSIESIGEYDNGCPLGKHKMFYKSGVLMRIDKYEDCHHNGLFLVFNENGDTTAVGTVKAEIPIGLHKIFYAPNRPKRFIHYNDSGRKHGWEVRWYDNGNVRDSLLFEDGDGKKHKKYYYNGQLCLWDRQGGIRRRDATTYDIEGNITGRVTNGTGTMVYCDSLGQNCTRHTHKNGNVVKFEKLPPP